MATLLYETGVSVASGAASVTLTAAQAPTGSMILVDYTDSLTLPGASAISGFNLIDQAQSSNSSVLLNDGMFYRIATADGITITTTDTGSSIKFLQVAVFTGHDGNAPKVSHGGSGNTTTQGNPIATSISADNAGAYLFAVGSTNAAKVTSINGMSPTNGNALTDRGAYRSVRYSQAISAAGAIGDKTLTVSSPTSPQRANIMTALVGNQTTQIITSTDTGTGSDSSDVFNDNPTTDTAIGSDLSDISAVIPTADTGTGSDISDIFVTVDSSDSGVGTDNTPIIDQIYYITSTESGTGTDNSDINATVPTTDTGIGADVSNVNVSADSTDIGTGIESSLIDLSSSDSGIGSDVSNEIGRHRYDSGIGTDTSDLIVYVQSSDDGKGYDVVGKLRTEPLGTEDPFTNYEPAYTKSRRSFRVLAQDIFTGQWIHNDLPIIDPELTFTLSGYDSFQAILNHEHPSLLNLPIPLLPYRTWLHVEEDYVIRQSTILQSFMDDNKSRTRVIEGNGISWYPKKRFYKGPEYTRVYEDPANIVRFIWQYIQSRPDGNLGVIVDNTKTTFLVGEPKKNVSFQTSAGQNVDFDAGPYDLNWWEVSNLGTELDKLYKANSIEHYQQSTWNSDHSAVIQRLRLGFPRVGRKRTDIFFKEGMNLSEIIPKRAENEDSLISDISIIGAGEGALAVRGLGFNYTGRLAMEEVLENEDITNRARAQAIAKFEAQRRAQARSYIDSITIDASHSNAPWGSFIQGDDILVEGTVIGSGQIQDWNRITSYVYKPRRRRAVLNLSPSAAFTYDQVPEIEGK